MFGKRAQTSLTFTVTSLLHAAIYFVFCILNLPWCVQVCLNWITAEQLSNPMDFSDSCDTLCTFFKIHRPFNSCMLTFVLDSDRLPMNMCKPCVDLTDPPAPLNYVTCFPGCSFRRIPRFSHFQSKKPQRRFYWSHSSLSEKRVKPARTESICEGLGQRKTLLVGRAISVV